MTPEFRGQISRRRCLEVLGTVCLGTLLNACGPKIPPKTPVALPVTSKDAGYPLEAGELGYTLNYAEAITIGKIDISNKSSLTDLTIAMSRISLLIGTEAGLLQITDSKLLPINFVDNPKSLDSTGGDTYFDPLTGEGEVEIPIPTFINKLKEEARKSNTPLTTMNRRNGYLSVLLSQATLVEISNLAHLQKYRGQKVSPDIQDQINKASNQLGVKYVQQIIDSQAKPFIIVNKIKQ